MTQAASGIIHVDGGSRGNPGPAGYGFVILREGQPPLRGNGTLGHATNNVAEYTGLLRALAKARDLGLNNVLVRSDSELLVRQMNGQYRVKNEQLQGLFAEAKGLADEIGSVRFVHAYREQNAEADRLANLAMDGTTIDDDRDQTGGELPGSTATLKARRDTSIDSTSTSAAGWDKLREAFCRLISDGAVADALVEEVKKLGFAQSVKRIKPRAKKGKAI